MVYIKTQKADLETSDTIRMLLQKHIKDTLTREELKQMLFSIETVALQPLWKSAIAELSITAPIEMNDSPEWESMLKDILRKVDSEPSMIKSVHFFKTIWIRYAAAVAIIFFGLSVYFWTTSNKSSGSFERVENKVQTDVPPGGNKALLTLSNGSVIVLDSTTNGTIARQGNTQVVKLTNGQIAYRQEGKVSEEVMLNTMSTPKGGQYQLILPDGTKVWLNAASSITYPIAFVGKERKVKVTGECYFEVIKNKNWPFLVNVDGKSTVQVLGTSFNINSYPDENNIRTTLIEGSLKIVNDESKDVVLLLPGQQAVLAANKDKILVKTDTNTEQDIAWKSGLFNFSELRLQQIMPQFERWYDVKVTYQGTVPQMKFYGELTRDLSLAQVLKFLEQPGLHFTISKERIITVIN